MPERAIFLDRDNTIIENDGYLGDPTKVKLLPGVATALASLRALGYRLVVVSNQSGVARGMFDEAAVEAVNQEMCRQLKDQGNAQVDASYYCPYHPEAKIADYKLDHEWRKPRPGMLLQAARDFQLDLTQSWMIGDQPRDIAAGATAGCRTILLRDPDHQAPNPEESKSLPVSPNYIIKTLADAIRIIAREGATRTPTPTAPEKKPEDKITSPAPLPAQPAVSEKAAPAPHPTVANLSRVEKSLDDLVQQLRHQSRVAEAPRDFPRSRLAAFIVQILAALALVVGFTHLMGAPVSFGKDNKEWFPAVTILLRSGSWLLIALFLQLVALMLFQISKEK